MKKFTYRILSLAAALALATQSMVMMAFAAEPVNIVVNGSVTGTANKQDVFYYAVSVMPGSDDMTTTIMSFEPTTDWLVLALPADTTATVDSGRVMLATTADVNAKKQILTVAGITSARIITTTTPIVRSVVVNGLTKDTVEKGGSVTLTATVNRYDGTAATGTVTWPGGSTTPIPSNAVSVTSGDLVQNTAGKLQNLAVSVSDGTTTTTLPVPAFTVTECKKSMTGLSVTPSTATPLAITGNTTVTFSAGLNFGGEDCNVEGHTTSNHGKAVSWSAMPNPLPLGISFSAGTLNVTAANVPAGSHTITVTATANPGGTSGSTTFTLTKAAPIVCGYTTVQKVEFTNPPQAISAPVDKTVSVRYTPVITWNNPTACNTPGHGNDPTHGKGITWNVAPAVAGVTLVNGELSVDGSKLPAAPPKVAVTATIGGVSGVVNNITLTKTYSCTKVLAPAVGSIGAVTPGAVTGGALYREASRTVLAATGADTTLQLSLGDKKPLYTGVCQYEDNGQTCPTKQNHTVVWSATALPVGVVLNKDTGLISVHRDSLTTTEASVELFASVNGVKTPFGYIVVHKGSYSTGSDTTAADRLEQAKEAAYDKLEDQISYADPKDVVRLNIADYPQVPTRILGELRGKNVTAELSVGNGYTWIINGKNLQKSPSYQIYLPLGITRVTAADVLDKAKSYDIRAFEIDHTGSLYGSYTLEIQAGSTYANKTVYLYKYVEGASRLTYKGAARVDDSGYVRFPFTSASTYVLTERSLYGETANTQPGGTTSGGTATVTPPPASKPASSSSSSSSSSEASSVPETITSSSSSEASKPVDVAPEEPEKPAKPKAKLPIIVPILLVIVTITVIAVVLLAKGGRMNMGD